MAGKQMKFDVEQVKMIKEMFSPMEVRPLVRATDHDSFATFTSGLRQNWVFVMALFGVGFWIVTNTLENKTVDARQDTEIHANSQAIINLNKAFDERKAVVDERFSEANNTNNEVIRRLDNLAKDIEIIKGK